MLICWIWRVLSIELRAEAETRRQESRSKLLKLMGFSTGERTPVMMNFSPRRVRDLPIGSPVPKRSLARLTPITAVFVDEFSRKKVPDFKVRFWTLRKSEVVPTTVAEGTISSARRVFTDTAIGATAEISGRDLIAETSLRERLDLRY